MGRFLQVDPKGYQDSLNLYQGFGMNPVNFLDPFGEELRPIKLFMSGRRRGTAITFSYPHPDNNFYKVPTYNLNVSGTDDSGHFISKDFEVLRFGVRKRSINDPPKVVGIYDYRKKIINKWFPDYRLHSSNSGENGAWIVTGNFLIHDGPDDPMNDLMATIGCIEICGPMGFSAFNDLLISLSGADAPTRQGKLFQIAHSGKLEIEYEATTIPPLIIY